MVAFENVEHLQNSHALRLWAELVDIVASIICRDRFDPLGIEFRKIRKRQQPIILIRKLDDLSRNFALVERVPSLFGDQSQSARKLGHLQDLAVSRGTAIDQQDPCRIRSLAQLLFRALPLARDDVGYWKTCLGILDGRRKNPAHRKLSILLLQLVPTCDGSGHGYGIDPSSRYVIEIPASEEINGCLRSRPTASIQTDRLFVLLHVHEREHVAADTRHYGLDHVKNRCCCDSRVYGIPAVLQNA